MAMRSRCDSRGGAAALGWTPEPSQHNVPSRDANDSPARIRLDEFSAGGPTYQRTVRADDGPGGYVKIEVRALGLTALSALAGSLQVRRSPLTGRCATYYVRPG